MSEARQRLDVAAGSLSAGVLAFGIVLLLWLGGVRFVQNGTLWMDEAGVALSLLELSPGELFGRLVGGYSFPRPYLLAIRGVQGALGFEPWVLRLLPFAAYVAGSVLWLGLFWRRFREVPWLLALGVALVLIPSTWPVYGAMFKQYSFDVFVALLPFCLSDRFYEETLREGRRSYRLALLSIFCAVSFTYAFSFLGRLVGFYAAGLSEKRFALHPAGVSWAVAGLAAFTGCLYLTDLRHTGGESGLFGYWEACLIDESPRKVARSIKYFLFGWYFGRLEFVPVLGLPPAPYWVLRVAFVAGTLRLALQLFGNGGERWLATPGSRAWGSRSLGCAAALCGFLIAAAAAGYPVCPGRLTVFALFFLQVLTLEGLDAARGLVSRAPAGRWIAAVLGTALFLFVAPTAQRSAMAIARAPTPENFRPLLPALAERSDLPVLATPCSTKQVQTVPEWLDASPVVPWNSWPELGGREVWILNAKRSHFCQRFVSRVRSETVAWKAVHDDSHSAELFLATLRSDPLQ